MKIKCIIVDDEPVSRQILKKFVVDCPQLQLMGVCNNAFEANELINKEDVQLIFLDINMPKLSGLTFYKSLTNPPFVVFTTAYPEYAVEGFEVDAVDFLLKPFSFERFLRSVNKVAAMISGQSGPTTDTSFILLKSDKKLYRVMLDDIIYLEALGDYVRVHYADQSILVRDTFQNLLQQLEVANLVRIHKSFAISLNKFDHIEGNLVKIKGKSIPIGQTYRSSFMEIMKSL